jgi:hypothetical protein
MYKILILVFALTGLATFSPAETYQDRPDSLRWVQMKSGPYFDQRFTVTANSDVVHFETPRNDAGDNRGAWLWPAPAGEVITKVIFTWRYNGIPAQFKTAVFAGSRDQWDLNKFDIAWFANTGKGAFSGTQTLTFRPEDHRTGIGFGFEARGPIYKGWQAEFKTIVIETAPDPAPLKEESSVTVKKAHLWRNDQRFKLWGVNFCASIKQEYPDLPLSFDRMADVGFNGIRINLFDGSFIDGSQTNTHTVPRNIRQEGQGSQIDMLDYSIYLAKQKGMIFWMMFDRLRHGFVPGDYDVLPDDGTRKEWEKLIKIGVGHLVYIDGRAEKAHQEFVRALLEHINPYTGYRYADDPTIGIWETFNENTFVENILNTGLKNNPVAVKRIRSRWNDWLIKRYGSTQKLLQAWGKLNPEESLEKKTVEYAPLLEGIATYKTAGYQTEFTVKDASGVRKYTVARGEDVVRFACALYMDHTKRFSQFVRSLGKPGRGISVVPICPSGKFGQSLPNYYVATAGDIVAVGNYGFACRPWEASKQDPYFPFISRMNMHPLIEHPLDFIRPAGKPYLYYETNDYRPNPFIVEYPIRMAASLVYQDGDGACWFNWDDRGYLPRLQKDEDYVNTRLPMPDTNYPNAGLLLANDEVMLAAIKAAGAIFRQSNLPPASRPTTYRLGKDILLNLAGCNLGGLEKLSELEGWLRNHAWREGVRMEYDPEKPSIMPKGANNWQDKFVKTGPYMTFDWSTGRGYLHIDAPTVKAHIGFNSQWVKIGDTLISGLNYPFTFLSFVAEDGRPLNQSKSILVTMVSRNTNTGFFLDPTRMIKSWSEGLAEAVADVGQAPVITDRVSAKVTAPWLKGLTFQKFNFARKCFAKGTVSGEFYVREGEPLFYARLTRN